MHIISIPIVYTKSNIFLHIIMYNDRYEMAKFASTLADVKHGLEERLQQWNEYEGTFDRIISWLNESEALLKNYGQKNTLQEKTDQLDRFQVCSV